MDLALLNSVRKEILVIDAMKNSNSKFYDNLFVTLHTSISNFAIFHIELKIFIRENYMPLLIL
jgi:hypothetical protein